jgi:hypothetical protein
MHFHFKKVCCYLTEAFLILKTKQIQFALAIQDLFPVFKNWLFLSTSQIRVNGRLEHFFHAWL